MVISNITELNLLIFYLMTSYFYLVRVIYNVSPLTPPSRLGTKLILALYSKLDSILYFSLLQILVKVIFNVFIPWWFGKIHS